MPIHDWTRVEAGIFHHFHQRWISALCDSLNQGGLPGDYYALAEQNLGGPVPDAITLQQHNLSAADEPASGGVATVATAPKVWHTTQVGDAEIYAAKADRIAIHHPLGDVVAVIEIVSPGNKSGKAALRSFVEKSLNLLQQGIHLLIVDLFPPTKRDPQGIHKAIWDEIRDEPFELPRDKPLTLVAYNAGFPQTAYVEPASVGADLPAMPLFLDPRWYVPAPLEATYRTTWSTCPRPLQALFDSPAK